MKSLSLLPAFQLARIVLLRCFRCGSVAAVVGRLGIATVSRAANAGTAIVQGWEFTYQQQFTFGVNGRF